MTSTRSAMSATTPRSCVTKITPLLLSRLSCLISFRICAWMVTSSAVVGSSAISTPGDSDSAIRVITVTDFPEPDSPTIATTSPRSRVNETPSTARTRPSSVANETCRSCTSSSGSVISHHLHVPGPLAREPYPGVEQRVHDVVERAEQHHEEGGEHRAHQDRRHVEVPDRLGLVLPDPGEVEHGLGDQRGAAQQHGEVKTEHRDDRHQRVAQHTSELQSQSKL